MIVGVPAVLLPGGGRAHDSAMTGCLILAGWPLNWDRGASVPAASRFCDQRGGRRSTMRFILPTERAMGPGSVRSALLVNGSPARLERSLTSPGCTPGRLERLPVVPDIVVGVPDRPSQPLPLNVAQLAHRGGLDRLQVLVGGDGAGHQYAARSMPVESWQFRYSKNCCSADATDTS